MGTGQFHKAQRIGVFVDVQNLYYSARFMYNGKVNFKEVLKEAVRDRTLIRAIAYVIKTEDTEKEKFFDALENIGFEVKGKDLQIFHGGNKKGDWDIGIAMDMIEQAHKLDTCILISGDGDFDDLLNHLKRAVGCKVEVVAFGRSASSKLKNVCDEFIDLDKDIKRFLIPGRRPPIRKTVKPGGKNGTGTK